MKKETRTGRNRFSDEKRCWLDVQRAKKSRVLRWGREAFPTNETHLVHARRKKPWYMFAGGGLLQPHRRCSQRPHLLPNQFHRARRQLCRISVAPTGSILVTLATSKIRRRAHSSVHASLAMAATVPHPRRGRSARLLCRISVWSQSGRAAAHSQHCRASAPAMSCSPFALPQPGRATTT